MMGCWGGPRCYGCGPGSRSLFAEHPLPVPGLTPPEFCGQEGTLVDSWDETTITSAPTVEPPLIPGGGVAS